MTNRYLMATILSLAFISPSHAGAPAPFVGGKDGATEKRMKKIVHTRAADGARQGSLADREAA
jgi:hypothetical protein